ncbi:hypothetical protein E1301_Tti016035 [Triplophysa tibetana]|uniref:C1q domain-containing protein n=1 Tax=Triplophysa tibetana TaxID=1572043 RepID=A0A5A9PCC8_9TELE|nr:hypothetical protein E1301_Tti016035 [Triplophysa tibetana]
MKLVSVLMLNVWAITADILSPNINILDELQKIKTMEVKMKSMESEMEQLRTKNTAQEKQLASLNVKMNERTIKMDELIIENKGIFTVPMRGVYVFLLFSKAYGGRDKAVVAGLFKNDQHVFSTYAGQSDGFISSSNGVSLLLEKGDRVYVNLYPGYWIFDNEHHHSTFSGHLLFQM